MIEPAEKTGMRNAWGRVAEPYAELWAERTAVFAERGLDLVPDPLEGDGLDVGCGPGLTSVALARRLGGHAVVGVDFSPQMIEWARARWVSAENVTFDVDDAENLARADGAYGTVISAFALMYCYDALAALGHMARVLRPGGRLLLVVWGRHDRVWWSPVIDIIESRAKYYSSVCPMMFFYGLPGVLPRMLEQMGMQVDETADLGTPMRYPNVDEAVRAAILAGPLAGIFQQRLDEAVQREVWDLVTEHVTQVASADGDEVTLPGEVIAVTAHKPA